MRYILKDYQEEAVKNVLDNFLEAKEQLSLGTKTSFALTAPTGSGKTVISAAVIEAILKGNEHFERDKNATIIWFSDSPDLNRQSKYRIQSACPEIFENMKEIDNTFSLDSLETGNVYFINTQKFGSQSSLVRKAEKSLNEYGTEQIFSTPDRNTSDIWEVIKNTIEDPNKNLYFFIDEAHRGTGEKIKNYDTILKRLIKGHETAYGLKVPPMPIIFGISATPQRFNDMMSKMEEERLSLENVNIDIDKVQESGLLKDIISLSIPDQKEEDESIFLRNGIIKLKEMSSAWEIYCKKENIESINPIMVVQTKNINTKNQKDRNAQETKEITEYVNTIISQYPDIGQDSFVNVYGEHKDIETFNGINIRYVSPETIQDDKSIKIVFAKEAISTGWDCPRAEVLVSFRPAKDKTSIAQIIGRMVRTPLSRRIDGDEILNSTTCILPSFNKTNVIEIVNTLSREKIKDKHHENNARGKGRKIVVNSINMFHNNNLTFPSDNNKKTDKKQTENNATKEIIEIIKTLPTYSLPKKQNTSIVRAINMATELDKDKICNGEQEKTKKHFYKLIDESISFFDKEINKNIHDIQNISIENIEKYINSKDSTINLNELLSNDDDIEMSYQSAEKILKPILTKGYIKYKVDQKIIKENYEIDDINELIIEEKLKIAALSRIEKAVQRINNEANSIANNLRHDYKEEILSLNDERKEIYEILDNMSNEPIENRVQPPISITASTQEFSNNNLINIPKYKKHIISDNSGDFPTLLNELEKIVLHVEEASPNFIGWYKNPTTGGKSSLMIPYEENTNGEHVIKIIKPNFIIFTEEQKSKAIPSIIEINNPNLQDFPNRLKGLAKYAEKHSDIYYRIESVINLGTDKKPNLKILNLKDKKIRKTILETPENKIISLYKKDYN